MVGEYSKKGFKMLTSPIQIPEKYDVKKLLKYQPYWFFKRFEFTKDDEGQAFYNPFRVSMFLSEFRVFYAQTNGVNYNGMVELEVLNNNSDTGYQVNPYLSMHICSWSDDIQSSLAPSAVDLNALGVNFTAIKLGSVFKFNIPFQYNSPIEYKIRLLSGDRPSYFDIIAIVYLESGRVQ